MASIGWPLYVFFLLTLIIIITCKSVALNPAHFAHACDNNTMFASNSKYHTNLNTVFRSLTSNATNPSGYYATSSGKDGDNTVYGLFLCRGDLTPADCRDCVSTATNKDLPTTYCPNRKVAIIWYDECMVRYNNESITNEMEISPAYYGWNVNNVTDNVTLFKETMEYLMNIVVLEAYSNKSNKKYGTNVTSFTGETMFGLAQCTPDLNVNECYQCLHNGVLGLPVSQGGRYVNPSCNVRYETYPFFTGALLSPPPSQSKSPPPPSSPTNTTTRINPPDGKKKASTKVIIAIVASSAFVTFTLLAFCFSLIKKTFKKNDVEIVDIGESFSTVELLQYDVGVLQVATNNFSDENKIGEGGFGCIYKGTLANGKEIAVKKLSRNSSQGVQEFKNEVVLIAKLQHRNLVRLLGFCFASDYKLLVYEYVPNKSLDYFLFDQDKKGMLDLQRRRKIIEGISRGMLYLHQDSQFRIIHRDLKASNILLDKNLEPKISDFGMARLFDMDQSQGNTSKVVGTYGYMSPEYAMRGEFSIKSDIYSFGVLLLEIVSGNRNSTFYHSGQAEDLLSYAWKVWKDNVPLEIVDPMLRDSCSTQEAMRYLHLGLLCVQESPQDRPTMPTIVLSLDSETTTLPFPEQPAFFATSKTEPKLLYSEKSSDKSVTLSTNGVTISELYPR